MHEDLFNTPQAIEVGLSGNNEQSVAAGQVDGKAHQAVLDVLLVDAVLVNPQA